MNQGTAIVTGAARGIGLAISQRLVGDGFITILADIDAAELESVCQQIEVSSAAEAIPLVVDVANPESVRDLIAQVIKRTGRIDVLVNNAGIAGPAAPVAEYPDDEWRRVMAIDLDGTFYMSKAVLPHMLERNSGRIVNIASIAGKEGNPNMPAYSAAKAGVIGFTKSLAKEVATKGILVNCITPAVIETEIVKQLTPQTVQYMVSRIPLGRVGRPEEVAALVSWLASSECTFSTGAVFDISGGRATY